jgi:alanyl-tRNA synthetase
VKENKILSKKMESYKALEVNMLEKYLVTKSVEVNSVRVIAEIVDIDADAMKNLSFKLRGKEENLIMMLIAEKSDKVFLTIMITDDLVDKGLNASIMIREVSKEVNGGGGGQSFFATAGGSDSSGISSAIEKLKQLI